MGSPYLNSGEVIILTTDRVSVDAVLYDVMLTTERIFFIDNRNARFEPRIIHIATILSVQGGKTPVNDPVITLLFRTIEEREARQPLNLVFSQNPNENRKPERDEWVRTLIQLSINRQEKEEIADAPPVMEMPGETGLRPTARHGVAPEKVRPLSNVGTLRAAPAPVIVIPEEIDGSGGIPASSAAIPPVNREPPAPEPVPEETTSSFIPVRRTPPPVPAPPPARVIIPQIIEELMPAKMNDVPPDVPEPAPMAPIDPEALFRAIPTAGRSMTVTEERRAPPLHLAVEDVPEPEADFFAPGTAEQEEVPEIIKALHIGAVEPPAAPEQSIAPEPPAEPEPPAPDMTGTVQEPEPESPHTGIHGIPESHVTLTIPENVVQESVSHSAPDMVLRREPEVAEAPPIRHPIPPAREIRPLKTTLTYAAVALLVIVLVVAGALLLFPPGPGQINNPVPPTPGIVQGTTVPPETAQPTTVPTATTRIATPGPSLAASSVPQTGVWVRINSTAYYTGIAGNPDYMQNVSGTGDMFYKVFRDDRPVQVSVQKQDNSGAVLAVGVYRNGTLITTRSVTSPMGTVNLLIDTLTGRPPGLTENDMQPEHAATPAGIEDY